MNIRVATVADAEALVAFGAQAYIDTYAGHPKNNPADVAAYLAATFTIPQFEKEIADCTHVFLVCETIPCEDGQTHHLSPALNTTLSPLEPVSNVNSVPSIQNSNNNVAPSNDNCGWSTPISVARFMAITNEDGFENKSHLMTPTTMNSADSSSLIQFATINSMNQIAGFDNKNGIMSMESNESRFLSPLNRLSPGLSNQQTRFDAENSSPTLPSPTLAYSAHKPKIMAYAKMCIGVAEDGLDTSAIHPHKTAGNVTLDAAENHKEILIAECKPMKLDRLYVGKEFLGRKGIGSTILDECYSVARQNGCEWVWLKVWEENHVAQSFYTKKGFRFVGKKVFQVGSDPQVALLMQKELNPCSDK